MRRWAEVGVVGAGPAGARAAELLARQGVSVLLFDHRAPWEKPCGGGLPPAAFDEMPELGEVASGARAVVAARVELSPETGFSVELDRPLRIVSREFLGRWQLDRASRSGAVHVPTKVRSVRRKPSGWTIETDQGTYTAGILVGADGAASLVRRIAAPDFSIELAPTRVAYPSTAGPTPDTVVLKFYPHIAGYLWDFPRPDHRSLGIGVQTGTWRRPALDAEIETYRDSSQPCSCIEPTRAGAVIGTAQLGHGDFSQVGGSDYSLLGDAAGFADPLTGEGIRNAMKSASLLASAFAAGEVAGYPALARRTFAREFHVSRLIRRALLEGEAATGLIARGLTSDAAYAITAAAINAVHEHDGRIGHLLRKVYRSWRRVRSDPSAAKRLSRQAIPCECDGSPAHARLADPCAPASAAPPPGRGAFRERPRAAP